MNLQHTIPEYDITVETLIETIHPEFTSEQRHKLINDILNFKQEQATSANTHISDEDWDLLLEQVENASDEELLELWEPTRNWILSRRDVPHDTDSVVKQLLENTMLDVGDAVIAHQRFKRFSEDHNPDYGFLSMEQYQPETVHN